MNFSFADIFITILGAAETSAVFFVALRSRIPSETVRIQAESIAALQESHKINSNQIKELNDKVLKLEAENALLREIPLGNIETTQQKILQLLKTQNEILTNISTMGDSTVNVIK